jgi:mycofactocin biosynthesis protein MftB
MVCAASTDRVGVLDAGWRLAPQVAVRPEPFGALVYHFGTRRLTFLKSRLLLDVVDGLGGHASALDACRAAGVSDDELPRYEHALATLAGTGMIVARAGS